MPQYVNTPFAAPPTLMIGGTPTFLFGGFNDRVPNTRFQVTNVALTSNVATITGTVTSGNIPAVGSLISLQGTQTSSGVFNVSAVAIASVTINATTGQGTITFPLTNANISSTTDSGLAIVQTPVTFEAIANGSSVPVASMESDPSNDDARSYFAQVYFGTIPTAAVITLQGALVNQDSYYQSLGNVATVSGGTVTINNSNFPTANYRFLRFFVSGLSGTGTIAAALLG
jgi:hypothetical protein